MLTFVTLVETKSQTKYSSHKPDLHFLMRNDPYFHVGYAPKIESGASHNIKLNNFEKKFLKKFFVKFLKKINNLFRIFRSNF